MRGGRRGNGLELVFHHPWWIALLALPLTVGFALWLARGQAGLPRALRAGLVALRIGVLMLIVLLLLEPALRRSHEQVIPGRLPILIDVSQSMRIGDIRRRSGELVEAAAVLGKLPWPAQGAQAAADDPAYSAYFSTRQRRDEVSMTPRLDLVRALLRHPQLEVFDRLAQDHQLRYHMFADGTEAIDDDQDLPKVLDRGLPDADGQTDLGGALEEVIGRYAGVPLAGVVLISDGASNTGVWPEQAARRLKQQGVPLHVVGVGLPEPHDIRIETLIAREVLFTNDRVTIKARLASHGYTNRTVTLRATLDGNEVASKTVVLTGQTQFEQLSFTAPRIPGRAQLAVELTPLTDEASADNNRVEQTVRLIDEKIRVLYIEGSPRWEYRYLRSILKRDRRLETTFVMTEGDAALGRASPDHLESFPDDPADAFAYDLVILGDVRAAALDAEQMRLIDELVRERGGTLLMIGGEDHAPAEYDQTPIGQMLPVRLEAGAPEPVSRHVHPVVSEAGRQSMLMVIDTPSSRNDTRWSVVKPLGALPRVAGTKPGALVLATTSEPVYGLDHYPLIAWHRYGAGKVMFVGTDRLWRLRYKTGDEHHTRFWVQTVQFLGLSRLLGENKQVRIETDQRTYDVGQAVDLTVDAVDELFEPIAAPAFTVQLTRADQPGPTPLTLEPVPGIAGLYRTTYVPTEPGRYVVTAEDEHAVSSNVAEFDVRASQAEQRRTAMDQDLLRQMARSGGGSYYPLLDLPKLPEAIAPSDRTLTITREHTLWNTWLALALFLGLAGTEWVLRRQNGLA